MFRWLFIYLCSIDFGYIVAFMFWVSGGRNQRRWLHPIPTPMYICTYRVYVHDVHPAHDKKQTA